MKKIYHILSLLLCLTAFGTTAQESPHNFYFRNINKENGLSQTDIKAIAQTPDGFMWFGTRNKLNRYDGRNIKVFDCYDRDKNIRNNNISALHSKEDNSLFVGTDIGVFVLNPKLESFNYIDTAAQDGVRMTNWVSDIQADNDGNTWIVLPIQGVFCLAADGTLKHYEFGSADEPDNGTAESICIDKSGKIWIGTNGNGIFRYNPESDDFKHYLGDSDGNSLKGDNIYCMADIDSDIVIGSHTGKLRCFNKLRNTVTDFNTPQVHNKIIRDVKYFDDRIWVGTQVGVFIIDRNSKVHAHISYDPINNATLSDNQIGKIFRDHEKGVWIGTNLGGINYLSPFHSNFQRYVPQKGISIPSKRVRDIAEAPDGQIWLATEDAGISIFNPATGLFDNLDVNNGNLRLYDKKTLTIKRNGDQMWIGYFKNGIDVIDCKTHKVRHYSANDLGINEGSIYALYKDSNNDMWLGNGWSTYKTSGNSMSMTHIPEFGLNFNFDILEDSNHNIWVITMGNGVYRYNPLTKQVDHFTHNENDSTTLSSNSVSNIIETSRGQLWFSTDRGGICVFNPDNETFTSYSVEQGLPDDTAYKMLEDKNGYLWFGTNNGLVKFNPIDGTNTIYSNGNGLPSNQFSYKGALKASDGRFYFGCSEGFVSFDPYNIQTNNVPPPVYISSLLINNKEISPNTPDSPLQQSVIASDNITLSSDQNIVAFEFAALSYIDAASNIYAYRMDNINSDWVYTSNNKSMTYANLPPGDYTFHVKGANADGVWNDSEQTFSFTILPPWWRSTIAIIAYIILIIALLLVIILRWRKRTQEQVLAKERQFNDEKEKEIYRSKLDLYIKVAHEIRTPVTLIKGPLDSLIEMNISDPEISRSLQTMQRSTNELMTITNQLLDFRKIDNNKMTLTLNRVEITSMLKEKIFEFGSLFERKGITIESTIPGEGCFVNGDKNGIVKIINNLLSNAVRYCSAKITIELFSKDDIMVLRMLNDGEVIAPEYREKIFDPFYQMEKDANVDSSTGIGLNLARSLAEMMNGTLTYTTVDGLNCFTLTLGLYDNNNAISTADESNEIEQVETDGEIEEEKLNSQLILLVEDNSDMLQFMAEKLSRHYNVITASNGIEALKIINDQSTQVDMIITDLMMPQMDGMQLIRAIRDDIKVSHLPIIILTAKNDLNTKVSGLSEGADAYMEKPFSMKYLLAQIKAIFDKRTRDRQNYSRNPFMTSITNTGMSSADKNLIEKITRSIDENLTDPNFGVEMLAEQVYLSRSSLHRKLKDLTGTSPTDFVRLIRLKKAADLITEGSYRIGEVCYLVGINSPSYFIKIFQNQFGMTPKEFEKRQREQKKSNE